MSDSVLGAYREMGNWLIKALLQIITSPPKIWKYFFTKGDRKIGFFLVFVAVIVVNSIAIPGLLKSQENANQAQEATPEPGDNCECKCD